MVMVSVDCKGNKCKYYLRRYRTQVYHEAEMPAFDVPTDEYCNHPDIYKANPKVRIIDRTGVQLQIIKSCPDDK